MAEVLIVIDKGITMQRHKMVQRHLLSLFFPPLPSLCTETLSFPLVCYRNTPTLFLAVDGFSSALCCVTSPVSHMKESSRSRVHTSSVP